MRKCSGCKIVCVFLALTILVLALPGPFPVYAVNNISATITEVQSIIGCKAKFNTTSVLLSKDPDSFGAVINGVAPAALPETVVITDIYAVCYEDVLEEVWYKVESADPEKDPWPSEYAGYCYVYPYALKILDDYTNTAAAPDGSGDISINGKVPHDIVLRVSTVSDDRISAVQSIVDVSGFCPNMTVHSYDIHPWNINLYDSADASEAWQPEADKPVTVNIPNVFDTSSAKPLVEIYHILDTETAITGALANGTLQVTNDAALIKAYADEAALATTVMSSDEAVLAYTHLSSENGTISLHPDGSVSFAADSFSDYYVVSGTQSNDIANGDIYYILPGTTLELTYDENISCSSLNTAFGNGITVTEQTVSGTTWWGSSYEERELRFQTTPLATAGEYNLTFSNGYSVTIIIQDSKTILSSLQSQNTNVFLTCVADSSNIPNEPMSGGSYSWIYIQKNGESYTFNANAGQIDRGDAFTNAPSEVVNLDAVAVSSQLKQNLDGQNVIGVVDTGRGQDTLPCINFTQEQWHEILVQMQSSTTAVLISNGRGGTVNLDNVDLDETLKDENGKDTGVYRYQMYPYVVKMLVEPSNGWNSDAGWHIDCCVVDMLQYSVSYDFNLPATAAITTSGVKAPDVAFYDPNTENIAVGKLSHNAIEVRDSIDNATSTYTFVAWNTSPDGSGATYKPGDTLPAITENVKLYAIWTTTKTSGTVWLEKVEVFEGSPAAQTKGYSFTITFNGTELLPYNIYEGNTKINADVLSIQSGDRISLKGGQHVIINGVPAGDITVTEVKPAEAEFHTSWTIGTTEITGESITAAVTGGNQTNIICTNTYPNPKVTIRYEVAIGSGTVTPGSELVAMNTNAVGSTAAAADGYVFSGWYRDEACTDLVSGTATWGPTNVTADATYYAKFVRDVFDLTIRKSGAAVDIDADQSFLFRITGPDGFFLDVAVNGNGSVTVRELPVGNYSVMELTDWSWRYEIDGAATDTNELTITEAEAAAGAVTVTVTNERKHAQWLDGDSFLENVFGGLTE